MTDHATIGPAWVAALNELRNVTRDKVANVGTYSYRFADLAQVADHARDVLARHGLAVQQYAHTDSPGAVSVTTTVWHTSGESIESPTLTLPAKGGPQDYGSAITFARRYSLTAFLGLANDDDDGAGAQKAATAPEPEHPNAQRVRDVTAEIKAMADTQKEALKEWADGRSLAPARLLASETFLGHVEQWIDENTGMGS